MLTDEQCSPLQYWKLYSPLRRRHKGSRQRFACSANLRFAPCSSSPQNHRFRGPRYGCSHTGGHGDPPLRFLILKLRASALKLVIYEIGLDRCNVQNRCLFVKVVVSKCRLSVIELYLLDKCKLNCCCVEDRECVVAIGITEYV